MFIQNQINKLVALRKLWLNRTHIEADEANTADFKQYYLHFGPTQHHMATVGMKTKNNWRISLNVSPCDIIYIDGFATLEKAIKATSVIGAEIIAKKITALQFARDYKKD